jgi:predicted transcriptional regulator
VEPRTNVNGAEVRRPACAPNNLRGLCRNALCAGDIMSKDIVTAAPDDTILSVARNMSEQSISGVVVTDKGRVVGILTEKDMLNTVAGGSAELYRLTVSERMSSPVDTISAEVSILEADRIMEVKCIRRLPVVENGRLVGIVTQTDITRALISLNSLGCVSDIMTKHVATVPIDATVMEAARLMSCSNISCLVVTHEERFAGILTEKDLLKRIMALQKDPAQTRVVDVMSLPVVTVPSHCSIFEASKKMETMHFHRLLVTDGKAICGLVTQTDIMRAVRRSFEAVESHQQSLKMEMTDLLQRAIRDIQRVRDFLGDIPHPPAEAGISARIAPAPVEEMVSCASSMSEES